MIDSRVLVRVYTFKKRQSRHEEPAAVPPELHKRACMSLLKFALCHASLRVGCAFRGGSATSVISCQHAAVEQSRATTTQV